MKHSVYFTDDERDFLIQVMDMFCEYNDLKNLPVKTKLLLNATAYEESEIILMYLYLREVKKSIEKALDNPLLKDDNLLLNYKGVNHCLRTCRKSLDECGVDVNELCKLADEFLYLYNLGINDIE